jgi:UDPglucose 6-dehydrogenase
MNITIIGTGYVGLVSGVCLAELGHNVTCIDSNPKIVSALKKGKITFYEPGMENLISKNIKKKRLKFTISYEAGTKDTEVFFICVGTPSLKNGSCNTKYIKDVANKLSKNIETQSVVFVKSTVPIGTNEIVSTIFNNNNKNLKIYTASNPEFLKEGDAINDFMNPDRIVIGTEEEYVKKISKKIYHPLIKKNKTVLFLPIRAAELSKYASNAFLATKISFMNELSFLSDRYDININDIKNVMSYDERIGKHFLNAGLGFGGSCFPKDLASLRHMFINNDEYPPLISAAMDVNKSQLKRFEKKIESFYKLKSFKQKNILFWGLSFKPNTDDIRESQAIKILKKLSKKAKHLYVYDPQGMNNAKKKVNEISNITFIKSQYQHISKCDALVLCTEWSEFSNPDVGKLLKLKDKVIFDGRNILDRDQLEKNNLSYFSLGN